MILSVSRRTDIPAFYADWFFKRLSEGYLFKYNNKLNAYEKISITNKNVDCIVFWSKNPEPLLKYLPQIDALGFSYYFQFTITPYGDDIERNLSNKKDVLKTFRLLSKRIGSERVVWRYDPILLNDKYTVEFHKKAFGELCRALSGYTNECVISFVDETRKGYQTVYYEAPDDCKIDELLSSFSYTAKEHGIQLLICSEEGDYSPYGIKASACIDREKIESIIGLRINSKKDHGQRKHCNCVASYDIGDYFSCLNNCCYCYAGGTDVVKCNYSRSLNSVNSPLFIGNVNPKIKIVKKNLPSLVVDEQISLFG